LFAVLLLLVLLTIVVRLIVEGEFPDQIGREGFGWRRATKEIAVSAEEILDYVESIDADLQDVKRRLPPEPDEVEPPEPPNEGGT